MACFFINNFLVRLAAASASLLRKASSSFWTGSRVAGAVLIKDAIPQLFS